MAHQLPELSKPKTTGDFYRLDVSSCRDGFDSRRHETALLNFEADGNPTTREWRPDKILHYNGLNLAWDLHVVRHIYPLSSELTCKHVLSHPLHSSLPSPFTFEESISQPRSDDGGKTELALILPHLNTDRQSREGKGEEGEERVCGGGGGEGG